MKLLDAIDKLITEHGSATILRERLQLIKEQADTTEKQLIDAQKENAALKTKITEMEKQIAYWTEKEKFVEGRGGLFKRKPEGGYHVCVYCPRCFSPMSSFEGIVPFICGGCHMKVSFTGKDLQTVMRELP